MSDLPKILKAEDISGYLNISRTLAYALMKREDFPTLDLGKSKRVKSDDFLDWLEKTKHKEVV